jgi:hypothetical protein
VNAVSGDRRQAWVVPTVARRVRPLGEDLAPPRPLYFIRIPLLLAFSGVLTWITASEYSMVIASIVAAAIGCYMLYDWVVQDGETRYSTIIAFGLLLGYGLGAFNTWATTSRGGFTLGQYLGYDDAVLARGMAAVLLSAAITIFFGEIFERPLFGRDFRIWPDRRIYSFIYVGAIAIGGAFATGAFGFSGEIANQNGQVDVTKTFLLWLFSPLIAVAVSVFLKTPHVGLKKISVGVAVLILLIFSITMGRRNLIYTSMVTIFLARISGFPLRGSIRKKLLIFIPVGIFVVGGALGFMLLRVAGYGAGPHTHKSLAERVTIAYRWIQDGSAWERALSNTQSNVKTRTFVLGFFSNVLEGSSTHRPGMGRDTVGLLQLVIPSAIYPDKDRYFSEEALTDQLFGFSYTDEANSVLTNGATDFGLIGVLFFPLIVAAVLKVLTEFAARHLNQFSILMVVLANLFLCLQAENSISALADAIFHGLIFSVGILILFSLPRFQLRNNFRTHPALDNDRIGLD